MKTKEELNALREEVEKLNGELSALTEEELAQVTGGVDGKCPIDTLKIIPYLSAGTAKSFDSVCAMPGGCPFDTLKTGPVEAIAGPDPHDEYVMNTSTEG